MDGKVAVYYVYRPVKARLIGPLLLHLYLVNGIALLCDLAEVFVLVIVQRIIADRRYKAARAFTEDVYIVIVKSNDLRELREAQPVRLAALVHRVYHCFLVVLIAVVVRILFGKEEYATAHAVHNVRGIGYILAHKLCGHFAGAYHTFQVDRSLERGYLVQVKFSSFYRFVLFGPSPRISIRLLLGDKTPEIDLG